jgi:hypothetical protein
MTFSETIFLSKLKVSKVPIQKKLDLRGVRQPPDIVLRRRHSHTGRENPRTPTHPYATTPAIKVRL